MGYRVSYLLTLLVVLGRACLLWGQSDPPPEYTWGTHRHGELRSLIDEVPDYRATTLTGAWLKGRQELADEGIIVDGSIAQFLQGNAHGGLDTNSGLSYFGAPEVRVRLDFARMGLWEGGFVSLRGGMQFGRSLNCRAGTLSPVNFAAVVPMVEEAGQVTLSEYYLAQALSEKFVVVAGKVDILNGSDNMLLGSLERDQFLGAGMRTQPALNPFIPHTTMVLAGIWLPNDRVRLMTGILDNDPADTAKTTGFSALFNGRDWFTVGQELDVKVAPWGRPGHQTFGYAWRSRPYRLMQDRPDCDSGFPGLKEFLDPAFWCGALDLARKRGIPPFFSSYRDSYHDWVVYYRFEQYVHQEAEDPRQGWGFYGRLGLSTGKSNPIERFYSLGWMGRGGIPERDNDNYGIGYYRSDMSDYLPDVLHVHSEQGVEMFYNMELRPGVRLTPDLQVIVNPGAGFQNRDVAIVYGLRLQIYF
ncbi:MAG: carbohydrate porin [Phycisphaerae bacterium]|nr:carbohydrate porin [Phycisphaerae bacterium]